MNNAYSCWLLGNIFLTIFIQTSRFPLRQEADGLPSRVKQLKIHSLLTKTPRQQTIAGQLRWGRWTLFRAHISHSEVRRTTRPHMCIKAPWRQKGKLCQRVVYPEAFLINPSWLRDAHAHMGGIFVNLQSLSCVWLFATPWTAAHQASLSFTNSQSLLKFMSIESMMPLNLSSSVIPFSSRLQSFPASGSFPMSWLFGSGGLSLGASASASILPMTIQGWFPLGLIGLISLH